MNDKNATPGGEVMKNLARMVGISMALMALTTSAIAAEFREGELIVKYKENSFRPREMMNDLYVTSGALKVRRFRGTMNGFEHVMLQDGVKVQDAMAEFMKNDAVEYVQPNYILHALPIYDTAEMQAKPKPPKTAPPCIIPGIPYPPGCQDPSNPGNPGNPTPPGNPNPPTTPTRPDLKPAPADVNPPVADPELSKLYGLGKIGAQEAWKLNKGSKNVIVADIDTGIDYNHEDLAFNLWRNPNPNQRDKDIVGFDFVHNDGLPFDDNEHGTHTAGTIGAVGGNGKGVSGVAQRVSIMALKFLSGEGSGTTTDAIRAIDYAIAHGAKIMSNSWGGKGDDNNAALKEAIDRARVKGILFVAAAGNDGTDNDGTDPSFPASFDNDNMLVVAATNEKDTMAFFSNYGKKTTHLAAPGTNIYSTVPGNKYTQLSGTSMACPHVSGAAALIWSMHPDWTYQQVKKTLMDSVDPLPTLQGKTVTGGRLNILKALRARR